jgi:hypothetical protein
MWDVAAEVVLGPHLEKWIVHNERDQMVSCQHIDTLHCCMPAHCLQAGELVHHQRFPALPASLQRGLGGPCLLAVEALLFVLLCWCLNQALLQVARSLRMRDPVVVVASFDRPAYRIRPNQKLQGDWLGLRQFVKIEHPEYAHIIDNKLMDMVSGPSQDAGMEVLWWKTLLVN